MHFAIGGSAVAAGERAALVALDDELAQGGGEEALFAPDVERHGVATHHDGQDVGVAGEAAGFAGGDAVTGVQERGSAEHTDQRLVVDVDQDPGPVGAVLGGLTAGGVAIGKGDQCVGSGLVVAELLTGQQGC